MEVLRTIGWVVTGSPERILVYNNKSKCQGRGGERKKEGGRRGSREKGGEQMEGQKWTKGLCGDKGGGQMHGEQIFD